MNQKELTKTFMMISKEDLTPKTARKENNQWYLFFYSE